MSERACSSLASTRSLRSKNQNKNERTNEPTTRLSTTARDELRNLFFTNSFARSLDFDTTTTTTSTQDDDDDLKMCNFFIWLQITDLEGFSCSSSSAPLQLGSAWKSYHVIYVGSSSSNLQPPAAIHALLRLVNKIKHHKNKVSLWAKPRW